ncbi:unnamed protein product [Boreogadus saida]
MALHQSGTQSPSSPRFSWTSTLLVRGGREPIANTNTFPTRTLGTHRVHHGPTEVHDGPPGFLTDPKQRPVFYFLFGGRQEEGGLPPGPASVSRSYEEVST